MATSQFEALEPRVLLSGVPTVLTSGNSTATIDDASGAVVSWVVDGFEQLGVGIGHYYRVGSGVDESPIGSLNLTAGGNVLPNMAAFNYEDNRGSTPEFNTNVVYTLTGGAAGSGDSSLSIRSSINALAGASAPIDFSYFELADLNLTGTAGDDSTTITVDNFVTQIVQTDPLSSYEQRTTAGVANFVDPAGYEVGNAADLAALFSDGLETNLGMVGAAATTDAAFAWQYDFELAAGPGGPSSGTLVTELSTLDVGQPPNSPPTIESLTDSPDPVVVGDDLTLTAVNAADDDGDVVKVEFFRDSNNNGMFDDGTDEKLGEDTNGADGYSLTTAVTWAPGEQTYFARAMDDDSANSNVVETTGTVIDDTPLNNVDAFVRGKKLKLVGDDGSNKVLVEQLGHGVYRVTGFNGTSINGELEPFVATGVHGSFQARMNDGDDMLTVMNAHFGHMSINTNDGDDMVCLKDVAAGRLSIDTGKDDDLVKIDDSFFYGFVHVKAKQGNDGVYVESLGDPDGPTATFLWLTLWQLGQGDDHLGIGLPGQDGNSARFLSFLRSTIDGGSGTDSASVFGNGNFFLRTPRLIRIESQPPAFPPPAGGFSVGSAPATVGLVDDASDAGGFDLRLVDLSNQGLSRHALSEFEAWLQQS